MSYHLLLAEAAVLFFRELDEDDQSVIWFRMKRLAGDPGQEPDLIAVDNSGREIEGVVEGVYAILYYVDHAVKEIKVIDIRFADV